MTATTYLLAILFLVGISGLMLVRGAALFTEESGETQ